MAVTTKGREAGRRLRSLRQRRGLSVRGLAARAGVTAAMVSLVENGLASPSLGLLSKVLNALGSDLSAFSGGRVEPSKGVVFRGKGMPTLADRERCYTIVFPAGRGVPGVVLDEHLASGGKKPPFEVLRGPIAGYVLAGSLALEVEKEKRQVLEAGDAFRIEAGRRHRGYAVAGTARLITVQFQTGGCRNRRRPGEKQA